MVARDGDEVADEMSDPRAIYAAVTDVVIAAGGYRRVGYDMWPHLGVRRAGPRLAACLDPRQPEKLHPREWIALLALGRRLGMDGAMHLLAAAAGYAAPPPIDTGPECARIRAELAAVQARTAAIARDIGRLDRCGAAAVEPPGDHGDRGPHDGT